MSKLTVSSTTLHSSAPDDPDLRAYLLKLKMWFGDPAQSLHYLKIDDAYYEVRYRDKCDEVSTLLKQKASLLGEFVAAQMSGLTQERDCSMPSVELHLSDLMSALHSSAVGVGRVRCGGQLERSVLYKALADRLGVPCALRRRRARAWCELAVPEGTSDNDERYPAGLLRANYVIDLMQNPWPLVALARTRSVPDLWSRLLTHQYRLEVHELLTYLRIT
ncbi:hypothetical protein ACJJTC_010679 [Scirpophaga incertulas]